MIRIVLFGATGSMGTQSLDVLRHNRERFQLVALTAHSQAEKAAEFAKEFSAESFCGELNEKQIQNLVQHVDMIINALPGFKGLQVSVMALKAGKILLSANKESLSIAGKHLRAIAAENGGEIRPLDSEASALWELIHEHGREKLKAVTLTCSGGPFYGKKREELLAVSRVETLNHPTWKMGPKVTVDSATLVNKVLEVYEVHHLFDIPLSDIHIVIHRQSYVHGILHTLTGGTRMRVGPRDMRLPIAHALYYPEASLFRSKESLPRKSDLTFDQPDVETFRPLAWLKQHKGNPNFPIALNALNDLAVQWFLDDKISFIEIWDFIEAELPRWIYEIPPKNLDEVIHFHQTITSAYEHRDFTGRGQIHASRTK